MVGAIFIGGRMQNRQVGRLRMATASVVNFFSSMRCKTVLFHKIAFPLWASNHQIGVLDAYQKIEADPVDPRSIPWIG